jgi:Cys-tRNA(Pro)/Cys-tRNA(Cys) deacylase
MPCPPGGISPLTRAPRTTVASVARMGSIYCGSGRADETIEVEAVALIEVVKPLLARITA